VWNEVFETLGDFGFVFDEVQDQISGSKFDDSKDVYVLEKQGWYLHRTLNISLIHLATNGRTINCGTGFKGSTMSLSKSTEGAVDKSSDVRL
jgi:hypothetical protein